MVKLAQPVVGIQLAVQLEGKAQGLLTLGFGECAGKRCKPVEQVHFGKADVHRQLGAQLLHQFPQPGTKQDGLGLALLFIASTQASKINRQHNAIQGALGTILFQPGDEVGPQPLLDIAGGALAVVLAQQFAVRVNQYTVVAHPPFKTERVTLGARIAGDVGEGVCLP